ncbi:MAG: hypothetical protein L0Y50_11505 [Beijerinckiaceae bacterium]|nr:hypothetical protein [Beijerinckiaceae bacterium]
MDQSWIEFVELSLKAIAVVGAGVWAFAALRVLQSNETADVSLRNSEAGLRELELRVRQQAAVSVDIKPEVQRCMDGEGYVITAVVELANRGSQNTTINWKEQPPAFHVRLAKFDTDGKPKYDPPARFRVPLSLNPRSGAISHVLRPGATESIPFAFKVASAGLYLLSFRGAVDTQERSEAERHGLQLPEAWTGNKYVLVGQS